LCARPAAAQMRRSLCIATESFDMAPRDWSRWSRSVGRRPSPAHVRYEPNPAVLRSVVRLSFLASQRTRANRRCSWRARDSRKSLRLTSCTEILTATRSAPVGQTARSWTRALARKQRIEWPRDG